MKNLNIKKAQQSELEQIYMMGFDVWADGSSEDEYIAGCRGSQKYARGEWYVLTNDSELTSSLIVYNLGQGQFGIGSIATPKELRKQGFASVLIIEVIKLIEATSPDPAIFLYSDIGPEFYERFDFVKVPLVAQRYKTTTCMVRGKSPDTFLDKMNTPEYF